jgi:hypothetical protein
MELTENNQPIFINEVLDKFYLLLDQLDTKTKVSIISKISESILKETETIDNKKLTEKEEVFYSCFGSWDTEESADELISMIHSSRCFREREVDL